MPKNLKASDRFAERHFDEITDFLWKNRKRIIDERFDYTDYGGLPKRLSDKLSSDFVEAAQEAFDGLASGRIKTKEQFSRICAKYIYAEYAE